MKSVRWFSVIVIPLALAAIEGVTMLSPLPLLAQASNQFEYKDSEFWSNQCLQLNAAKQYAESIAACERAIALQPKRENMALWSARSEALFQSGKYAESLVSYDRVLKVAPKSSFAIAYQCAGMLQLDQFEDAVDTCEKALKIDGNWGKESPALALFYRGLALRKLGRLETALASYELARSLKPDDALIAAERCSTLSELGSAPEQCGRRTAIAEYDRGLAANANNSAVWIQQAWALEQVGEYQGALTSLNQALKLRPDSSLALARRCGVLNALEDYKTAFESCEGALQGNGRWGLGSGIAYAWTQRSTALLGLSRFEEALAAAKRASAINANYAPALNNQAVSLWQLARYDEAREAIKQAIATYTRTQPLFQDTFERLYPDALTVFLRGQILAQYNQGRIFASLKAYKAAASSYSQALAMLSGYKAALGLNAESNEALNPLDRRLLTNVYVNQAANYLQWHSATAKSDILAQADEATQNATKLSPDSFAGWYNRGLILAKLGRAEDAIAAYDRAAQISPNNLFVLTAKGMALKAASSKRQEAIAIFEQILNLDPKHAIAKQSLADLMKPLADRK